MTDRETAERTARAWVEGYVRAWTSNDPAEIRALFTDDAEYRTEPWLGPTTTADGIAAMWQERFDEPGTWEFEWDIAGIDGGRAFVQGVTRYAKGTVYSNLWVIDLADDGRARRYTEWWMDQSDES